MKMCILILKKYCAHSLSEDLLFLFFFKFEGFFFAGPLGPLGHSLLK